MSTRDQRIAEELSINCETFDTLLSDRPRARNLLGRIVFGKEQIDKLERSVLTRRRGRDIRTSIGRVSLDQRRVI